MNTRLPHGHRVARQSVRLGVHLNFAPVVDINSNPTSPVMGSRSFGEDKENVALKGVAYMQGMQDKEGSLPPPGTSPGHGDSGPDLQHAAGNRPQQEPAP